MNSAYDRDGQVPPVPFESTQKDNHDDRSMGADNATPIECETSMFVPELQSKLCIADSRAGEVVNNGTSSTTIPRGIDERASIDKELSCDTGGNLGINTSVYDRIASNVEGGSSNMVVTRSKRTDVKRQDQKEDQRKDRQPNSPRITSSELTISNVIPYLRGTLASD